MAAKRTNSNKRKQASATGQLLLPSFAASAVTGIGLHIAGHGISHAMWHGWAVAHVTTSILWVVSAGIHVKRHRHWYQSLIANGIGRRSLMTLTLSLAFTVEVVTGIALLAWVEGANSITGLWHFGLGILLVALSLIHIVKRRRGC